MRTHEQLCLDVELIIAACTREEILAKAGDHSLWGAKTYDELVWRMARFACLWSYNHPTKVLEENDTKFSRKVKQTLKSVT